MSDLDSFFAKKDKKKDKFKGRKFGNPEEIAKQLEENEKKLEKDRLKVEPKVQLDEVLTSAASDHPVEINPRKEEEEWKDFTEKAEEDLTDLKISRLQIEDEEDGMVGFGSADDEGHGGPNDKADGVWKKNIVEPVPEPPKEIEEVEAAPPSKSTPSSYVPPHLRNAQPSSLPRGGSRRPKQAPDITNEMSFPSLGSQPATPSTPWGRSKKLVRDVKEERGFENVKHGSTRMYQDSNAPPNLSTNNRFDALSDNS